MSVVNNRTLIKSTGALALLLSALQLAACGGSSSSSDDAETSIASRGLITGFGSVYVNGKRFRTASTRFSVDDANGTQADLRVGMLVTVRGASDDGEWFAEQIEYDNELKGPVTAITPDPTDSTRKTLTILGQAVSVTTATTIDDDGGLTFDSIAPGDVLEVSGFITDAGLVATHIELQNDDLEIEIRGRIDNLTGTGFDIRSFPVSYDGTTELEDVGTLAEDMLVEVEGRLNFDGTLLIAEKIEREDGGFGDGMDEIEFEGVISEYSLTQKTFVIQHQLVDAATALLEPANLVLADGLTVEVEGHFVNRVLVAEKIKQRGNKIKISAPLAVVGSDSVTFSFTAGDIPVQVNPQTELEDETGNPVTQLGDFSVDDFVELEAFRDGSGTIYAIEIERVSADEIEVEAAVSDFDETARTVVLLGIEFDLTAARFEGANDAALTAQQFFDALAVGRFIEIEDADRNGVFDKAELED